MRFSVGEDQSEQKEGESRAFQRGQCEPKMCVARKKQKPGNYFDDEISRGNPFTAIAALTAQNQPTKNGDVVVEADRMRATGTGGARPCDGQSPRQTVDTHVQKTAEDQAENKNYRCNDGIQAIFAPLAECEIIRPDYKLLLSLTEGYQSHCTKGQSTLVERVNQAAWVAAMAGDSGRNTAKTVPGEPGDVRLATRIHPECFWTMP